MLGVFLVTPIRRSARLGAAPDVSFQLTKDEFEDLKCQIGISTQWGGRRYPPYVFTEHGALMLASVLRSTRAIEISIAVVHTFARLR